MNWPISAFRRASAFLFSASLLLAGCEAPNEVGLELPGSTLLNTQFQDLPVTASTVRVDSLTTLGRNFYLAGRLYDPALGTITARTFFETKISVDSLPSKFQNAVLDSVVLYFGYDYVYGPSAKAPLRLDVFRLATPLDELTTYNSNSSIPVQSPALLTNAAVKLNGLRSVRQRRNPGSNDTTTVVIQTNATALRVPLPKTGSSGDFVNQLFSTLNSPDFSQQKLDALLPGLAIAPNASYSGGIVRFDRSAETRAVVYFRGARITRPDSILQRRYTISYGSSFPLNISGRPDPSSPRYFTQIVPSFSGALANLQQDHDEVPASSLNGQAYLQDASGLATKLKIAGLDELAKQGKTIVNRAELLIPVKSYADVQYGLPPLGVLYEVDGKNRILTRITDKIRAERVVQETGYLADRTGNAAIIRLNEANSSQRYYQVIVTGYVQAYLNDMLGQKPDALVFAASARDQSGLFSTARLSSNDQAANQALNVFNNLTLNRAVLDANNIRLRVYYSRL